MSPGDQKTLQSAAVLNLSLGKIDRAIDLGRRAVAVDPLSYWAHNMLGWIYFRAGYMADAENSYRLSESLRPPDSPEATWIVLLRIATGDAEAALAMAEGRPRAAVRLLLLAMAYHALGDDAATDAALEELTERYPGWDLQIAAIHAMRGELDTAFARLSP